MVAPFDFSKLLKDRNKRLGLRAGFSDPITWIDTGNFALNKMISDHFDRGVPLGAVTVFAGESGCLPANAKVRIRLKGDERIVSVGELRDLFIGGEYDIEIDTPDGYQPITTWFDKGVLPLVSVTMENGLVSRCAVNHLLQRSNGDWLLATELGSGDEILTAEGISMVSSVADAGSEECFDFEVDHPNHRYWGDGLSSHNSGKSLIVSGSIIRDALARDCQVIVLDPEDALKETWMRRLGVDPDHPRLHKEVVSTIDHIAACIQETTKDYIQHYKEVPREEQQKLLFVVDSLGLLQTQAEIDQFEKGELKGDKGIKAKTLKMLVTNCIRLFSGYEIGLVATNHTYKSQDMYNPDDLISGGVGFIYASSIVVSMNKYKLKTDSEGKKTSDVLGIRSKIKCVKTRYAKPFEEVEVTIPYETGMNPYSGLFDMCEQKKVFVKDGNRYRYVSTDGTEHKLYRKDMTPEFYDMVMREWSDTRPVQVETTEADDVG